MSRNTAIAVLTLLAVPVCGQVIEQTGANATALFGLRADHVGIGQGQSFAIATAGTIAAAAFQFENTGHSEGGVPAGSESDTIACTLRSAGDLQQLASAVSNGFSNPMPGTRLTRWLCFPFSFPVSPGQYVITCETLANTHYGFSGNTDDASYAQGTRYSGFDGVWIPFPWDATFRVLHRATHEPTGSAPAVLVVATPSAGPSPLQVHLQAQMATEGEPSTFLFWWDCDVPSADVASVQQVCGAPSARIAVTGGPVMASHHYETRGHHVAKVVAQSGCNAPSEARVDVFVSPGKRRTVRSAGNRTTKGER